MSEKLTFEKAKEYIAWYESFGNPRLRHGKHSYLIAQSFLDGHASRDPELARTLESMRHWRKLEAEASAELSAEREASRKLVIAAERAVKLLPCGGPEMRPCYCCDLKEALKFYATPGHSPEDTNAKNS